MILISASFLDGYSRESTRVEISQNDTSFINLRFLLNDGEISIRTNKHYAKVLRDQLTEAIEYKPDPTEQLEGSQKMDRGNNGGVETT